MVRLFEGVSAVEIHVAGIVQGVGFRPHVYKLAALLGLKGWVLNTTAGVTIRLEGSKETLAKFAAELHKSPPPLARIENFQTKEMPVEGYSAFFIHESKAVPDTEISIPPDVGNCPDCQREYHDHDDRRYGYDYTNCVNCGPRFSITRAAPYDRKNTSMTVFPMCDKCAAEYADPTNRRFHAEPNACPVCGPKTILTSAEGMPLQEDIPALLKAGKILAIKGIGGYHLACDAQNSQAVSRLRERKRREMKPFAVMCRDLETIRKHCKLSQEEEKLLTAPARPIVLLKRKENGSLPVEIAPGLDTLGVMLPYTPLHYSLLDSELPVLVMTSANISGDPLIVTEEEAYRELKSLADAFVIHQREIINRSDDSVLMVFREEDYFLRRSRGYVPLGVKVTRKLPEIFAAGGDLKSAFAFARGEKVTLSQYFGDLDNLKNLAAYKNGVGFFKEFLRITPKIAVADLHPAYVSTKFAEELGLSLVKVQHHKAHFASCLADNGLAEKVLGVVCDGTGYGEDGSVWGCEFFYGDYREIIRVGSLDSYLQPRGDAVQKNPLHMAALLLYTLWQNEEKLLKVLPEGKELLPFVKAQAFNNNLSISSSSAGRIFDAAAALCGFSTQITYEGEAAMRMEALAAPLKEVKPYRFNILQKDGYRISWDFLNEMAEDKLKNVPGRVLAARFHITFAEAVLTMLKSLKKEFPAGKVVFSGGTFQNRLLINYLAEKTPLTELKPYFHRQVPTNDGGLALGQIMLAAGGE